MGGNTGIPFQEGEMTDYLKYFSGKELRSFSVSPLPAFYPLEGRL